MTVLELIQQLQKLDPAAEIIVFDDYHATTARVASVAAAKPDPDDETPFAYMITK